ncbi:hypothetical protein HARRISON_31 [Paenibacillus phage Harrison]|uniref:Uncharacterized protein n=2 Tax=Harrisonvirus harrison TaxID=1982221 RepID=A0A0K2CYF6_9CAUD|nr:hypothetical protein HARRISON_31 [Paenibacillus phage Harrison]ALA12433.1 hypothetical protein HARRISON_31 [Paenibacillus phage Harrison]ALA12594.1 hypothetical protein PAISLEY_31 [Paenibacillus phage Paisley]UYL93296.1 hypothetical protein DASH_30 [Paenibacillus phage Dash]UYL93373.1 hypothetical protein LILO_27 [Paenibacillus phage Lilo]
MLPQRLFLWWRFCIYHPYYTIFSEVSTRLQNHGFLGEMVEKSFCQDLCNVFIDNLAYNQLKKYYRANIEEINGKK